MRTLILVVFTVFVLTLGYMAYWWMQPARQVKLAQKKGEAKPALTLVKPDSDRPFGPGKRVWVKRYDEETAKLASRFRAEDYTPRADGWVVVKQPRAQFFMRDGRAILIQGESGEVIMDDQKKGMKAFQGSNETPSRGRLNNVTIYMYHGIENPEEQLDEDAIKAGTLKAKAPAMTITLNNASFDNQTFKIYSEGYGKRGSHVAADEVPVTLRGDDYDFDGRGLVIRWNERDRRLQLLEIAHGEKLVIKRPSGFMKKQQEEGVALLEEMRGWGDEGMRSFGLPLPVMLAAKGRAAVGEAIQQAAPAAPAAAPTTRRVRPALPKPKITPNQDPPLYRAIFHENVKIVQGDELAVTANRMNVDFLLEDQGDSTASGATTQPSGRKSRKGAATQQANAGGTTGGATTQAAIAGGAAATTQPAQVSAARRARRAAATQQVASTQPTTQPTDEKPIIITWTGKLVVEPLAVGQENPIKNGEAVVRLDGTPVTATQQGSTILAGSLTYRTEDQTTLLTPVGPGQPVVMKDTKGSIVHTARMDYFQPKRQAILYGVSDAVFPQEDADGKPGTPLLAKWTKTCTLYFAEGGAVNAGAGVAGGGAMNIERAELDGDVFIEHPQLKMKANALDLAFDTSAAGGAATQASGAKPQAASATVPATRPSAVRTDLRQLVATGAVHCDMTDASKKTQTIDCNRLTLQTAKTADGRLYPNTINADGDVRAVDPEQDLRAGHLAVTLRPAAKGEGAAAAGGASGGGQTANAELQSMVAHQNVVVVSKDGTRTTADQLLVDSKDGHNNLRLLGQPYATIVDKRNTLQGSVIEVFPDSQQLQIVGAGKMRGIQEDKATAATQPVATTQPKAEARPIDVAWQRGMWFDGKANTVDVTGQVVAITTDSEGAQNTARGERVRMILVDAEPTTKPAAGGGATTQASVAGDAAKGAAATRPVKNPNSAMASKTVRHISFDENATVSSETWGEDGALLRRTHLEASTLRYDLLAKQMNIPVPGRMIVEDYRPTTQPATGEARPASGNGDLGSGNGRGRTAFQWTKSFTYDEGARQAVMTGDERNPVIVVHQDDSPKAQLYRLTGQTVTAELDSAEPATTQAAAAKPKDPMGQQKVQLKRVTAAGRLVFTGPGAEIHATDMEFDPASHWLLARGNERERVEFNIAGQGGGSKQAEEVRYNLESGEVKSSRMTVRMAR